MWGVGLCAHTGHETQKAMLRGGNASFGALKRERKNKNITQYMQHQIRRSLFEDPQETAGQLRTKYYENATIKSTSFTDTLWIHKKNEYWENVMKRKYKEQATQIKIEN